STAMADDKLDNVAKTQAQYLLGGGMACLMHLKGRLEKRGTALNVMHWAELLELATRPDRVDARANADGEVSAPCAKELCWSASKGRWPTTGCGRPSSARPTTSAAAKPKPSWSTTTGKRCGSGRAPSGRTRSRTWTITLPSWPPRCEKTAATSISRPQANKRSRSCARSPGITE